MKKIRKWIKPLYDIIPCKVYIFQLLKSLGLKGSFTKYLYFKGTFSFKVEGKKVKMYNPGYLSHIENQIFWQGIEKGWERNSIKVWIELSKKANVILDVGANTGIFSLLSVSVNKNAKVIAFEPVCFIAQLFKKNMQLNHFNCELHEHALSNDENVIEVYSESDVNSYTISVDRKNVKDNGTNYKKIHIKTMRLDKFIQTNSIKKIDLMKIDVERHEPMVLEGMGEYLKIMKPDLLIEIQNDEIATKVQKLVEGLEYLYFNIDDLGEIKQTHQIEKSSYLNYLICSKDSAKYLNLL